LPDESKNRYFVLKKQLPDWASRIVFNQIIEETSRHLITLSLMAEKLGKWFFPSGK